MTMKEMLSRWAFWKSVILLGLSFLVIYNLVSMLFEFGGFQVGSFLRERTRDGKWFRFLLGQLLASFAYGFIIAFGQFRAKEKKDAPNQ